MIQNNDNELELFKSRISLAEYAEATGFALLKKESSKNCHVLKDSSGDKIVITRDNDGHDIYFNVHNANDSGSIIDFIQNRQGLNLGQVRKELRPWAGLKGPRVESVKRRKPEPERLQRPEPVTKDKAEILAKYHALKPYTGSYLEIERKLKPETIAAFAAVIRQDKEGNACFIHKSNGEVTGWERKNKEFTGFVPGGEKSLFGYLPEGDAIKRLVIVESGIDALSYYQLRGKSGDLYISIAGGMSELQKQKLSYLVNKAPAVVVATDNDKQGNEYANVIKTMRNDVVRETAAGKDWNDDVKATALQEDDYIGIEVSAVAKREREREQGMTL